LKILNFKKNVTEFCKYRIYLYMGNQITLDTSMNDVVCRNQQIHISLSRSKFLGHLKYAVVPQYNKFFRYEI